MKFGKTIFILLFLLLTGCNYATKNECSIYYSIKDDYYYIFFDLKEQEGKYIEYHENAKNYKFFSLSFANTFESDTLFLNAKCEFIIYDNNGLKILNDTKIYKDFLDSKYSLYYFEENWYGDIYCHYYYQEGYESYLGKEPNGFFTQNMKLYFSFRIEDEYGNIYGDIFEMESFILYEGNNISYQTEWVLC